MLIIFVFFSVVSMILVGCLAVAISNVVIRRESAYLLEERIKMVVDERKELMDSAERGVYACAGLRSPALRPIDHGDVLPGNQATVAPWSASEHAWINTTSFSGVVAEHGHLEIRSFRKAERAECPVTLTSRLILDDSFLKHMSKAVGLQVVDTKPALLG